MRTVTSKALVIVCVFAAALLAALPLRAAPPAPDARPPRILAQGTGEAAGDQHPLLWAGRVEVKPDGTATTTILQREIWADEPWQALSPLPSQTIALTRQANECIVLFPMGRWAWYTPIRYRIGEMLPFNQDLIALAGGDRALWGLGRGPDGRPANPTTHASTQAATRPATRAFTSPAGSAVSMLFQYAPTGTSSTRPATAPATRPRSIAAAGRPIPTPWTFRAYWPAGEPDPLPGRVSMDLLEGDPLIAVQTSKRRIRVMRYSIARSAWAEAGWYQGSADVQRFKVLAIAGRAVLWIANGRGGGELWVAGLEGQPPIPLALEGASPPATDMDLAVAGDRLRLVFERDGKLYEQRYAFFNSAAEGQPIEIKPSAASEAPPQMDWLTVVAMGFFLVVLMGALRRQRAMPPGLLVPEGVQIATRGRRLISASIDAVPLFVSVAGAIIRARHIEPTAIATDAVLRGWLVGGSALYLAHTLFTELLAGRTLGKMALGLWVAGADGYEPRPQALLVRNLLRVIDLPMPMFGGPMFIFSGPLLDLGVLFYSPLRQRVGDIAGGTLVIVGRPLERPPERDQPDDEEDDE